MFVALNDQLLYNPGYLNKVYLCYWVEQKEITGKRRTKLMPPPQRAEVCQKENPKEGVINAKE